MPIRSLYYVKRFCDLHLIVLLFLITCLDHLRPVAPTIIRSSDLPTSPSLPVHFTAVPFHTSSPLLFIYIPSVLGYLSLRRYFLGSRRRNQCPQTRRTLRPRGLPPNQHRSWNGRTASDILVRDDRGLGVGVGWTDGAHDGATGTRGQRRQIPPGSRLRGTVHRSKVNTYLTHLLRIILIHY